MHIKSLKEPDSADGAKSPPYSGAACVNGCRGMVEKNVKVIGANWIYSSRIRKSKKIFELPLKELFSFYLKAVRGNGS